MADALRHRKEPCSECPLRRVTDPGQFSCERYYEEMAAAQGSTD